MHQALSTGTELLQRLRGYRESVYAKGRVEGEFGKTIDVFPTGITQWRGRQLADLFRGEAAGGALTRTIETGFGLGLSTLFILEAALESSAPGAIQHMVIDPYQRRDWNNAGLRVVREAGVGALVSHVSEDSALALARLAAEGQRFDAAFVDGSHQFDGVFLDVFFMQRLVRPGGLIVLDDYWMPAVRAALDFFVKNLGVELEVYPDEKGRPKVATVRVPVSVPARAWDHFVPFAA